MRKKIFSSGPSKLPDWVLSQMSDAMLNYKNSGISIAEITHRSEYFLEILHELIALIKKLLHIPESHTVLIVQGGGRLQFAQLAANYLTPAHTAAYLISGYWSHKAYEYALYYGKAVAINPPSQDNYTLPALDQYNIPTQAQYVFMTSNNTIYGTQYHTLPLCNVPLVVDMSSDLFTIQRDFSNIDLAFACAQKNLGIAGCSVIIIKKDFLQKANDNVVPILSYKNLEKHHSLYATLPVVSVYSALLCMQWLLSQGGVAEMHKNNIQKATMLYEEIERNKKFFCKVLPAFRSRVNICFSANDKITEEAFITFCKKNNIEGIEGHVISGGLRASLYNATTQSDVTYLIEIMQKFEQEFAAF